MTQTTPIRIPSFSLQRVKEEAQKTGRTSTFQIAVACALLDVATPEQLHQAASIAAQQKSKNENATSSV